MTTKSKSGNFSQLKIKYAFKVGVACFQSGLFGFALFFTILIISKYLSSLVGNIETFTVNISDVFLSLIGFVLTFLIALLQSFSKK